MNVFKNVLLLMIAVGGLPSMQAVPVAASGGLRTVALVGDTAPGTEVRFLDFIGDPSMNDNGQIAFHALLVGPGGRNAIFSEGGGNGLALIARQGDAVPGANLGETYGRLASPVLNNNGQLLVQGGLTGTANFTNDEAIFSGDDSRGLLIVVRKGDEVPGTNSGEKFFGLHSNPLINSRGQVVFSGDIEGSLDLGIYSKSVGGELTQIAREGNFIPGTVTSERFDDLGRPVLSDSGQISFVAGLVGPEIGGMDVGASIFSYQASTGLNLDVRVGDTAPETEEGTTFTNFYENITVNDSGRIVFYASLAGATVDGTYGGGIFSGQSGSDHIILAREGDAVLGIDEGAKLIDVDSPSLNGNGQFAFRGSILGTGVESTARRAIFSNGIGSGLKIVAREEGQAPGADSEVKFNSFHSPSLNARGQTAFLGHLEGSQIDDSNDRGIYAQDLAGTLHLIARKGGAIDVSDDPMAYR